MTTYTSIRIYISSTASILPNGFYDVIGFYGSQVGSSTNPYHLDKDFNSPVIKSNGQYYYLTYRDGDGFVPTMVESGNSELHLLTGDTLMPIYLNQRDDAHIISNYDRPLVNNIVFDNIDNLYTAYRILYVDVYENYAIERHGVIVDNNNIIDIVDADFILAAQNPDGIVIVPKEGNVVSLKDFELTFRDNITATDIAMLRKIALYDYNTQSIAIGVDVNSIVYTLGENRVTFSLLSEITAPSQYFLYIPSSSFTYDTGMVSQMAMFSYTIASQQGGGDVWEFIYSPTQTKRLSKVTMTFVNVLNIVGLRNSSVVNVSYGSQSTDYIVSDICESSGNMIFITLPEPINNNGISTLETQITFSENSIQVQSGNWNESSITLSVQIVTEDTTLPTNDERYGISIFPNPGEVYEVRYVNILVKILKGHYGIVSVNDGHSFQDISVYEGTSIDGTPIDSVNTVNIKNQYTDEDGNLVYEYNCIFHNHNKEKENYTIYIPAELFTITFSGTSGSETVYNPEYLLNYTIKPEEPETGEDIDPNGAVVNFGYRLLMIKGVAGTSPDQVAFRRQDSIFVNRDKFSLAGTCPCLTVTRFDHDNGEAILSKNTLTLESGDVMDISIRLHYYNNDNIEVSTTTTAEYGLRNTTYVTTDLGAYFPMLRSSGYPNYMRLTYIFQYNGTELTHELELQFLPEYIYNNVRENPNWTIQRRLDLYSGTETDYQWGCLFLTHQYDCILNYKTEKIDKQNPEAEPVVTTRYVAELVPITKVRTGNLEGIYNEKFGANQPQGYGLYGENVYLTGNFFLNNGKSLMDISDDILLANGNINEIQDGLKNLDTSVKATIESLSLRQETFEHGLDASIKNYISTNKNAVLKIGLDYSIWALGSAGITMINPNATYDFDPITGNYSVNTDTVGDGDEYIALQGSKIAINTYSKDWFIDGETGKEKEYQEIIATTVNPALWRYDADGSIYVPKVNNIPIFFIRGYIESLEGLQTVNIPQTEETTELLKYVNFLPKEITSSQVIDDTIIGFVAKDEITTTSEVYSFTNYYIDTKGSDKVKVRKNVDNETTMVSLIDYVSATTIYFVPRLEQTGLFSNGKFNSKFIEAENLVAVDVDDKTYIKNRRFDPKEKIDEKNYPVLNKETENPAKEANFVVVSGTTGKLTAKGADIRGSITIGDHDNVGDTYVAITDNKGTNQVENESYPALYILKSQGLNKAQILSKFSGASVNDVNSLYSSVQTKKIDAEIKAPVNTEYVLFAKKHKETVNTGTVNPGHVNPGIRPLSLINGTKDQEIIGGIGTTPTTYYWYECSYTTNDSKIATADVIYNKTSQETITEFSLGPNESKTLAFLGNIEIYGKVPKTSHKGTLTLNGSLYIVNTQNVKQKTIIKSFSKSVSGSSVITIEDTVALDFSSTSTTVKNSNEQDSATFKIVLELNQDYSCDWNTTKTQNENVAPPNINSIIVKSYLKLQPNYNIKEGGDGYLANFFGNGVAIGFNTANTFCAYYKGASNAWNQNQMLISFKSNGVGMSFENGTFFNHIADHKMPGYIPILVGMFRYYKGNYYFDGRSLVNDGDTQSSKLTLEMKYPPYYSNYYKSGSVFEEEVDNRGRPVNTVNDTLKDSDLKPCIYYDKHDIYVVYIGTGVITILFGNYWNTIFYGHKIFVYNNTLKVSTVGIGRSSWDGTVKRVPKESLYVTVKPGIYGMNSNPIWYNENTRPTLYLSDSNVYEVEYNKIKTSTPDFYNAICVNLADDSSLNDGSFYLSLEVCANSVIKN